MTSLIIGNGVASSSGKLELTSVGKLQTLHIGNSSVRKTEDLEFDKSDLESFWIGKDISLSQFSFVFQNLRLLKLIHIGRGAFSGGSKITIENCISLESVSFDGNNFRDGSDFSISELPSLKELSILDSDKSFGKKVTEVVMNKGLEKLENLYVGSNAFSDCRVFRLDAKSVKSLTFGNNAFGAANEFSAANMNPETLLFKGNNFVNVDVFSFTEMSNLKTIALGLSCFEGATSFQAKSEDFYNMYIYICVNVSNKMNS